MLNQIVIMGRLTRDPELRTTQTGVNNARFTVAVDRDYVSRDGGERQTDFIDCVAWRQTAEFVSRYFRKGSMIVVTGRLQSRKWQDKETGANRTAWEIQAENVHFGESKRESDNSQSYGQPSYGQSYGSQSASYAQPAAAPSVSNPSGPYAGFETGVDDEDDLPF